MNCYFQNSDSNTQSSSDDEGGSSDNGGNSDSDVPPIKRALRDKNNSGTPRHRNKVTVIYKETIIVFLFHLSKHFLHC